VADSIFDLDGLRGAAMDVAETSELDLSPFEETLEALLGALASEAGLYPARAWRTFDNLVEELALRGARRKLLEDDPTLRDAGVRAPVFVVGLPRTGTTLLHNLLARADACRAPAMWELRRPLPSRSPDSAAEVQAELDALYDRVPAFRKIHWIHSENPDECSWLFRHAFSSLALAFQYYIPSYRRFLLSRPAHAAYADYRLWLQILGRRHPEGTFVLKDPCHLWHLDVLLSTFPDARVVHLHRDPAEAVPSFVSLCHTLHGMDSSRSDARRTAAEVIEMIDTARERLARAPSQDPRVLDVPYRELVADPLGTTRAILSWAGLPGGVGSAGRWLSDNRQHKGGRHEYSAEGFGMDPGVLRERYGAL
jgi:hypothetical protein